ncbi:MAG: FkbM family methyltransferase [Flavobacteriales bacterium]|nr:FkbM family methyltransferase [Flavobacteriales bacterium]
MGLFGLGKSKVKEESIDYEGYELKYSSGTSIVERFRRDGSYERDFVDYLNTDIKKRGSSGAFLDIGANIGMISLSVLKDNPNLQIFAFEPGVHQFDLFKKTLQINELENQIVLSDVALSNEKGTAEFRVHSSADVSGDGFIDTGRAGKTKSIEVKTDTLDNWWKDNGQLQIDFIKVDTEGAEYWILQGAKELLAAQHPVLYLEINDLNIRNYPFEIKDLFELIDELNYDLFSLDGVRPTAENVIDLIRENDSFVAYYREND